MSKLIRCFLQRVSFLFYKLYLKLYCYKLINSESDSSPALRSLPTFHTTAQYLINDYHQSFLFITYILFL